MTARPKCLHCNKVLPSGKRAGTKFCGNRCRLAAKRARDTAKNSVSELAAVSVLPSPVVSVSQAVLEGSYEDMLRQMQIRLAQSIDEASSKDLPALTRRLQEVSVELEKIRSEDIPVQESEKHERDGKVRGPVRLEAI